MTTALRTRRLDRHLTQEEVCELLGAPQTTYSEWERGRVRPRKPMQRKLEAVFGAPIDDLLKNDNGTAS